MHAWSSDPEPWQNIVSNLKMACMVSSRTLDVYTRSQTGPQCSPFVQSTAEKENLCGLHSDGSLMEQPPRKSAYQLQALPHEEMYPDARQIGIESNRRTNRSMNML